MVLQVVLNQLLLIELIADYFCYGIYNALTTHFRTLIEQVCQIFSFIAMYETIMTSKTNGDINHKINVSKIYQLIIFIRVLKMVTLLYELKTMRIIIETIRNLVKPLAQIAGVLFCIFYLFAQVGMVFFGG